MTVRVWDLESGVCEAILRLSGWLIPLALSCSHRRLVIGTSTGEVAIHDVRDIDLGSAPRA